MRVRIYLFVISLATVFISCRKKNITPHSELDKLPAVSQSGTGTFGFLLNSKAWIPKGWDGRKPNFYISVNPNFQNGAFELRAYRYIHDERESINIGSNDVKKAGIYPILPSGLVFVDYQSDVTGCYFYFSTQVYLNGFLKVTRYDYQNGIIAGEFEIKLYDPSLSCDTFKIENGRFDYKLF